MEVQMSNMIRPYTLVFQNRDVVRQDGIDLVPDPEGNYFLGVRYEEQEDAEALHVVEGVPLSPYFNDVVKSAAKGRTRIRALRIEPGAEAHDVVCHWEEPKGKRLGRQPDFESVILIRATGLVTSSMFMEVVNDGRVCREFLPAETPNMVGVSLLGTGGGSMLVRMLPGASFRMEGVEELGGASMSVRWSGWDQPAPKALTPAYESRRTGIQVRIHAADSEGRRSAQVG
jgi:hypothetical protein